MNRWLAVPVLLVLGFGVIKSDALAPAAQTIKLASEAAVSSTIIRLSDLLPSDSPEDLRNAGSKVLLGTTPEPGIVRQMTRAEIERALADNPEVLARISAPDEVTIRRTSRLLSPDQVAAAITAAIGPDNAVGFRGLRILLPAPIYFMGDDPGLKVTQVDFDALHQATRFRVWTSKEPENLAFYVTIPGRLKNPAGVSVDGQSGLENLRPTVTAAATPTSSDGATPAGGTHNRLRSAEKLISAGVEANLIIEGPDYRITSTVIPLQAGALGERIRVRDPVTRKVLSAQVAGSNVLRGTL